MSVDKISINRIATNSVAINRIALDRFIPIEDFSTAALYYSVSNQSANGSGDSDYRLDDMLAGSSSYTISFWVKHEGSISTTKTLVHSFVSGSQSTFAICMDTDGSIDGRAVDDVSEVLAAGTQYVATTGASAVVADTWAQFAMRVDAANIQLYKNGSTIGTPVSDKNNYVLGGRQLFIGGAGGAINSVTAGAWAGWIRDVAVVADLGGSDIATAFIDENGRPANLLTSLSGLGTLRQWYRCGPLDSNSDTVLIDSGPESRDGVRTGTPPTQVDATGASDIAIA